MICDAPSASKEERDALRISIEKATIARTGLVPKSLPDEARRADKLGNTEQPSHNFAAALVEFLSSGPAHSSSA
jgi:hypothetical protein